MSPPEVWGPAVWSLFHTLIEKMNPNAYPYVINSMFGIIIRICQYLPCPECSRDASNFLAKIKLSDYKTKDDFKNMLYLFHNWVNAKKRKPLYNYANMNKYSRLNLKFVVRNFIDKYNTKGNMKLLAESFQRGFVIKEFLTWFKSNILAFIIPVPRRIPPSISEKNIEENLPIKEVDNKDVIIETIETSNEETSNEETSNEETSNEEPSNEETSNEETTIQETSNEELVEFEEKKEIIMDQTNSSETLQLQEETQETKIIKEEIIKKPKKKRSKKNNFM